MEKNELLAVLQTFEKDFSKLNDALIEKILKYVNAGMTPEQAVKKALGKDYFGFLLPLIIGCTIAAALLGLGIKAPTAKQREEIERIIKNNSWSDDGINFSARFKNMAATMKQVLKDSLLSSQRQIVKLQQGTQGLLDYFRKRRDEPGKPDNVSEKKSINAAPALSSPEFKTEGITGNVTGSFKTSPDKKNILPFGVSDNLSQHRGQAYKGIPAPKVLDEELPQYLKRLEQAARNLAGGDRQLLNDYQIALRAAKREIEKFDKRHKKGGTPNRKLRGEYNEIIRICEKLTTQTEKFTAEALDRAVEYAIKQRMKYYASRVARSESAAAWFDGFIAKYQNDPDVVAYRWRLSSKHYLVIFDQCDVCANMNVGLGKGIYPKNMLPGIPRHPHCMCMLVPVRSGDIDDDTVFNADNAKRYLDSLTDKQRQMLFGREGSEQYRRGGDWQKLLRGWDGFVDPKSRLSEVSFSNNEQRAIMKYISSESYIINEKLRNGIKLSREDETFIKDLDSALEKLPKYQGTVYRSVSSMGIDVREFVGSHKVGDYVKFTAYTSTGTSIYDETMPIQYVIKSKYGVDLRGYNKNENEILFPRNTRFRISKVEGNTIYMED